MLRDTDIFVIHYTLDYLSNNRSGVQPPPGTLDLWPLNRRVQGGLLDSVLLAIEQSIYADTTNNRLPETRGRTDFIIDRVFDWAIANYGVQYEQKDLVERDNIHALIKQEFENHQPMSEKYLTGEPLPDEEKLNLVEEDKIVNDLKYNKTRIYKRS